MCGIAGIANWGDESIVARMTDALQHRGPDDRGVVFFPDERIGLGHRRLSIIDLSPGGHQPMASQDQNLWIVYNGEIFNFIDLRHDLESRGHRFRSSSDTEVLLHLYQEHGSAFVKLLNGMFAFAIFDRRAQTVLFARDHLGIKPLYYFHGNGRLLFGSEIKAILQSGGYSIDVNWQGVSDYFTFSCVPGPQTVFAGILQLPPAHTMTFDLRSGTLKQECYWNIDDAVQDAVAAGNHRGVLRELLTDSVRRQMIADVPLGVFLSGGIDSPILTGLASQLSSHPINTYTIIFEGKNVDFFNEREAAREVARKFRTDHHEIEVSVDDPRDLLQHVTSFDQPFANPTAHLMYLISSRTRAEVTVALCGAGGDELFAGYPRYQAMLLAQKLRHLPPFAIGAMRGALGLFSDDFQTAHLRRAREFLDGLHPDFIRQFMNWTYYLDEDEKHRLLRGPAADQKSSGRILDGCFRTSAIEDFGNRVLAMDVKTFLADNLLEYTDKMSMATALEVRVPYLDPRVVVNSLAIPFAEKLDRRRGKLVLRELFSDLLPDSVRLAPKKGFVPPLGIWMTESLDSYFDERMSDSETDAVGIFNRNYIDELRARHVRGAADYSYELFSIMIFDTWHRKYIQGEQLPNETPGLSACA